MACSTTTQNRSNAVMATRIEPSDSLDFFPTPPWATRALCEFLEAECVLTLIGRNRLNGYSVLEPACGDGHMSMVLGEYFRTVISSDIYDYGFGKVYDFTDRSINHDVDFVVTNPPFRLAEQFIERAIGQAKLGVAMLVRTSFLEGSGRYRKIFSKMPPSYVLQFAERVPMLKGRLSAKASTATSYCWLIWIMDDLDSGTSLRWIPPCRKQLERIGDYPDEVVA